MAPSFTDPVDPTGSPSQRRPARLAVGVVGTGRVGTVLAAALRRVGHRVTAVSTVSPRSRPRVDQLLPGVEYAAPHDVPANADLVLLTVPDDVLPGLVRGMAEAGVVRAGQLVAHTSGHHGLGILEPLTRVGALPLALHPVLTFTGTAVDLARLTGCSFGVTAPEPYRLIAEALVVEMGGEPVWIPEQHRPLYHAALAHGANHLVTLVTSAMDLLRDCGVDHPARMLGPLLGAALDNTLRAGDAALTGPVARGDAGTVATHLAELRVHAPDTHRAYQAMARLTTDRALATGRIDPQTAQALLTALSGDPAGPAGPAARCR